MFAVEMVAGDTAPPLRVKLTDRLTGAAIDMGVHTAKLRVQLATEAGPVASITGTAPNGGADGVVEFSWPPGTLATAGVYNGQIEITYQNGKVETLPNGSILVHERL